MMIKKRTITTGTTENNIDRNTNLIKIIKVGNFMSKKESSRIAQMTKIKITTIIIQIEIQSAQIIIIWITIPIKNIRAVEMVKTIDITNIEIN